MVESPGLQRVFDASNDLTMIMLMREHMVKDGDHPNTDIIAFKNTVHPHN